MLTRIRNASLIKSRIVLIRKTLLNLNICKILKEEGFIEYYELLNDKDSQCISISLKYKGTKQKPYITGLKRVSKPGFRVYVDHKNVPKILGGIGTTVFCEIRVNC
jgi:small subunit ribosomal protein S8